MRTLRRQPSMPDLAKGKGLYVQVEPEANQHYLRPEHAIRTERVLTDKSNSLSNHPPPPSAPVDLSETLVIPCQKALPHRIHSSQSSHEPPPGIPSNNMSVPSDRSVSPRPDVGSRLVIEEINPLGHTNAPESSHRSTSSGHPRYSDDTPDSPALTQRTLSRSLNAGSAVLKGCDRPNAKEIRADVSKKGARTSKPLVSAGNCTGSTTSSLRRSRRARKWGKHAKSLARPLASVQSLHQSPNPRGACVENHHRLRRDVRPVDLEELLRAVSPPHSPYYPTSASSQSSLYPALSRTSSVCSLPPFGETETASFSRSSRPPPISAIHTSKLSLAQPHFTPLSSLISLPESLAAEVIDLTEKGCRFSSAPVQDVPNFRTTPTAIPTPPETSTRPASAPQNTFYIPPIRPFPTLRTVQSVEPGSLRTAFTSSARRLSPSGSFEPRAIPSGSELETVRRVSKKHTPLALLPKTFALCSSVRAIEPLAQDLPSPNQGSSPTSQSKSRSPRQTAGMSLRVIFGRKGFIARRLSGAFEKHQHGSLSPDARRAPGRASTDVASHTGMDGRAGGIDRTDQAEKNRQWRQEVLSQAVSLSLSSRMVYRANTRDSTFIPPSQLKRSQRHRPRIPEVFLSAPGALLAVGEMGELPRVGRSDPVAPRGVVSPRDQDGVQGGFTGGLHDGKTNHRDMALLKPGHIVRGSMANYASNAESPPRQQAKTERDENASSGRPIFPEQQRHRQSRLFDMLRPVKLVNQRPTQGGNHAILPSVKVIPNTQHGQAYRPGHIGPGDSSYPEEQSLLPCQARSVLDRLAARDLVSVDGDVQPLASDIVDRVIMWRESVLSGSMQRVTGDQ